MTNESALESGQGELSARAKPTRKSDREGKRRRENGCRGLATSTLILFQPLYLPAVRPHDELMFSQIRAIDFTSNTVTGVRLPLRPAPTFDSDICSRTCNRIKPPTTPVKFGQRNYARTASGLTSIKQIHANRLDGEVSGSIYHRSPKQLTSQRGR